MKSRFMVLFAAFSLAITGLLLVSSPASSQSSDAVPSEFSCQQASYHSTDGQNQVTCDVPTASGQAVVIQYRWQYESGGKLYWSGSLNYHSTDNSVTLSIIPAGPRSGLYQFAWKLRDSNTVSDWIQVGITEALVVAQQQQAAQEVGEYEYDQTCHPYFGINDEVKIRCYWNEPPANIRPSTYTIQVRRRHTTTAVEYNSTSFGVIDLIQELGHPKAVVTFDTFSEKESLKLLLGQQYEIRIKAATIDNDNWSSWATFQLERLAPRCIQTSFTAYAIKCWLPYSQRAPHAQLRISYRNTNQVHSTHTIANNLTGSQVGQIGISTSSISLPAGSYIVDWRTVGQSSWSKHRFPVDVGSFGTNCTAPTVGNPFWSDEDNDHINDVVYPDARYSDGNGYTFRMIHPTSKKIAFHYGIDTGRRATKIPNVNPSRSYVNSGTPILAPHDGTIRASKANGGSNGGYGNYVILEHQLVDERGTRSPTCWSTLFAHLQNPNTEKNTYIIPPEGREVTRGQIIGCVGDTGTSPGAYHLHFEIHLNNRQGYGVDGKTRNIVLNSQYLPIRGIPYDPLDIPVAFPAPTVSFAQQSYSVSEGSSATVTVRLSSAPGKTVTIPISKTNQGGAIPSDYSLVPAASVVFNANETTKTIIFTAMHDSDDDDGESVKLGFGSLSGKGVLAGSQRVTTINIQDDDTSTSTPPTGTPSPTADPTPQPSSQLSWDTPPPSAVSGNAGDTETFIFSTNRAAVCLSSPGTTENARFSFSFAPGSRVFTGTVSFSSEGTSRASIKCQTVINGKIHYLLVNIAMTTNAAQDPAEPKPRSDSPTTPKTPPRTPARPPLDCSQHPAMAHGEAHATLPFDSDGDGVHDTCAYPGNWDPNHTHDPPPKPPGGSK